MKQNRTVPLKTTAHTVTFVFWSEETARTVETCCCKIINIEIFGSFPISKFSFSFIYIYIYREREREREREIRARV